MVPFALLLLFEFSPVQSSLWSLGDRFWSICGRIRFVPAGKPENALFCPCCASAAVDLAPSCVSSAAAFARVSPIELRVNSKGSEAGVAVLGACNRKRCGFAMVSLRVLVRGEQFVVRRGITFGASAGGCVSFSRVRREMFDFTLAVLWPPSILRRPACLPPRLSRELRLSNCG